MAALSRSSLKLKTGLRLRRYACSGAGAASFTFLVRVVFFTAAAFVEGLVAVSLTAVALAAVVLVRGRLVEADMVVFASPMYYFGLSAQLKRVIDRFYAINGQIKGAPKKAAFMLTFADTAKEEAEPMLLITAR